VTAPLTRFQPKPTELRLRSVTVSPLGGGGAVLLLLALSTRVKLFSALDPLPPEGATARSSVGSAAAWPTASLHARWSSEPWPISTSSTTVARAPVVCVLAGDGSLFRRTTTRSTWDDAANIRALASEAARRVHGAFGCLRLALAHAASARRTEVVDRRGSTIWRNPYRFARCRTFRHWRLPRPRPSTRSVFMPALLARLASPSPT